MLGLWSAGAGGAQPSDEHGDGEAGPGEGHVRDRGGADGRQVYTCWPADPGESWSTTSSRGESLLAAAGRVPWLMLAAWPGWYRLQNGRPEAAAGSGRVAAHPAQDKEWRQDNDDDDEEVDEPPSGRLPGSRGREAAPSSSSKSSSVPWGTAAPGARAARSAAQHQDR